MGFKEPRRTARLIFEGDYEGAEVVVRLDVDVQTVLEFTGMVTDATEGEAALAMMRRFGDDMLVSWNVEDDDGHPIPATAEGFMRRTWPFINLILSHWLEAVRGIAPP